MTIENILPKKPTGGYAFMAVMLEKKWRELIKLDDSLKNKDYFESIDYSTRQQFIRFAVPLCFKDDRVNTLGFLLEHLTPESENQYFKAAIEAQAVKIIGLYITKRQFTFDRELCAWLEEKKKSHAFSKSFSIIEKIRISEALDTLENANFHKEYKTLKI